MQRNVYLVQPNYSTGSGEFSSYWLPYSIGCLWAYARQFDEIARNFSLGGLYFKRAPIDAVVAGMREPAVVGFSSYVWNANYNRELAAAVKQRWPSCTIVFGGPEVPDRPADLFARDPYVDITVHQEGEITFTRVLLELLNNERNLEQIPGIGFVDRDRGVVKNPPAGRIDDLSQLPSPYLTGVFDEIVRGDSHVRWAATYETNRGCPFKCHFCDWGSAVFSEVKRFPEDRVTGELDWLADHRVEYVFVADANFGIFKERDNAIADHMLEVVERRGYPKTFCIQWTKNSNERIVAMAKKLSSVQKGLTLSVQTMTDAVLTAVERRNMKIHNLAEILKICDREGMTSYTELILGLPEETLASWKECFHRLLDLGQHCAIDVWIAQVLRNSAMNDPREIARYGIETVAAHDYLTGARETADEETADIPEVIQLVRATRTMPFEDLIDAYMYSWLILNFHFYGWTQLSARYLHRHAGVPYAAFYGRLFDFVRSEQSTIIRREYLRTRQRISEYLTVGDIHGNLKEETGLDLEIAGHNLLWLSQMVFHCRGREVFGELKPFLRASVSAHEAADLLTAQENALVFHGERYPKEFTVRSNLIDAVMHEEPLRNGGAYRYVADYRKEIRAIRADVDTMSMKEFLHMLYYKRRSSPGTTAMVARP